MKNSKVMRCAIYPDTKIGRMRDVLHSWRETGEEVGVVGRFFRYMFLIGARSRRGKIVEE